MKNIKVHEEKINSDYNYRGEIYKKKLIIMVVKMSNQRQIVYITHWSVQIHTMI
jgi:hypothetical protein